MTSPENPEPRPYPFPPSIVTMPRLGRGIRWSDLVDEMIAETGAEGDHLSVKEAE